jgi:5'/3'-nucleotidase SurE
MRPRPDIVVSGINAGRISAMTLSTRYRGGRDGRASSGVPGAGGLVNGHKHYDTAAAVTCSILRALSREPLRTGRILNINVPDLPLNEIKGIRVTPLQSSSGRSGDPAAGSARQYALLDWPTGRKMRCRAGYRFCRRG